jgi:hypothetical protein
MKAECMPGMVMPGCATSTPPSRTASGPPTIELALILIIILSAYVVLIFTWRFIRRRRISSYSAFSDWFGHTAHALGMIAMALLMIGTIRYIGPLRAYMVVFGLFALVFLLRLITKWSTCNRRIELWHVFISASMAYMFSATDLSAVTVGCLLLYIAFVASELRKSSWRGGSGMPAGGERRSLRILEINGDLTIAFSMMLMLALNQWPNLFT